MTFKFKLKSGLEPIFFKPLFSCISFDQKPDVFCRLVIIPFCKPGHILVQFPWSIEPAVYHSLNFCKKGARFFHWSEMIQRQMEQRVQPLKLSDMFSALLRIPRVPVHRKYIQINSCRFDGISVLFFQNSPAVDQLQHRILAVSLRRGVQPDMGRKFLLQSQQLIIIRSRHFQINVIIPWNESFITHRSQQRAAVHIIAK